MLIFKRVYKKKKRRKKRLTPEEKLETLRRRKWGMDVKKLNCYTCCITGSTNKKRLVAHHLNSFHTHPDQRYDLSNGVVIDKTLHKKFHKIYGYKDTTKEQFLEFMKEEIENMAKKSKPAPKKSTPKSSVKKEAKMPMGEQSPKPMKKGC